MIARPGINGSRQSQEGKSQPTKIAAIVNPRESGPFWQLARERIGAELQSLSGSNRLGV